MVKAIEVRPPIEDSLDRMFGYYYTRRVFNCFYFKKKFKCTAFMSIIAFKKFKFLSLDIYYLKNKFFNDYLLSEVITIVERTCVENKFVLKRWNGIKFYDVCYKKKLYILMAGQFCPLEILTSLSQVKKYLDNIDYVFFFIPNCMGLNIGYSDDLCIKNIIFRLSIIVKQPNYYNFVIYYQDIYTKTVFMQSKAFTVHKEFFN